VKLSTRGSSLMESLVMVAIFAVIAAIAAHKLVVSRVAENNMGTPLRTAARWNGLQPTRPVLLSISSKH
jgi:hypothetical protein